MYEPAIEYLTAVMNVPEADIKVQNDSQGPYLLVMVAGESMTVTRFPDQEASINMTVPETSTIEPELARALAGKLHHAADICKVIDAHMYTPDLPSPVLLSQGFLPFKVFRDILDYYSVALHSSQVRQLGNSYEAPRQAHVDVEALLEDAEEFMYGAGEDGVKAARDEKERRLLAKAKLEELAAVNKVIKRLRQVGGLGVRVPICPGV